MTDLSINTDFFDVLEEKMNDELENYLTKAKIDTITTHDGRTLFYSNLHDTSIKKYKIRYQIKNLIIDSLDKSILCMSTPVHSYYEYINKNELRSFYEKNKYSIIKTYDGTTVTIYNFNGTFYISSGRSTDISNFYWNGSKTFAQMFYESANTNKQFVKDVNLTITDSGNIKWNIPPEYCITLGFRHNDIHPNICDNNNIWFIQSYNRKNKKIEEHENLKNLDRNEIETSMKWDNLIAKCNRTQKKDQREKFYGYILTSNDISIPIHLQRVFIPSTLYKTLQYFFYSFSKNEEDKLNHNIRYTYSIIRNILLNNQDFLELLIELNPSYKKEIDQYNSFIEDICKKISLRFIDLDSNKESIYDEFITKIYNEIIIDEKDFNSNTIYGFKLITDYVKNPKNSYCISNLIIKNN